MPSINPLEEAQERQAKNAPPPGAKPKRTPKGQTAEAAPDEPEIVDRVSEDGAAQKKPTSAGTGKTASGAGNRTPRPGASPRPGARPKKRKR